MVISYLLLFLAFNIVDVGEGQNVCANESRCGGHGPAIRFPFQLNTQPNDSGYPGFTLSCIDRKHTVLELPISVKLFVKHIDYKSQVIQLYDPDNCFPSQLRWLNLSSSPFRFKVEDPHNYGQQDPDYGLYEYALFNCSSRSKDMDYQYDLISCLSDHTYQVYPATDITASLVSCTKMYNLVSIPDGIILHHDKYVQFEWFTPDYRYCEMIKGKRCVRSNSNGSETPQCISISTHTHGTLSKSAIVGVILGSFLLPCVFGLYCFYSYDKVEKEHQAKVEKFLEDYINFRPTRYSYADIKRITNQFSEKLGEGAYGTVFKGKLSNEIHVAVKILNSSMGNGEEFINEVGTMGTIHHVNVVRLVGFCADGFRRALVCEFLPNDSLEKYISSTATKNRILNWDKLQDITIGVAKGIEYLHQGCNQRILHFDIKPGNVLLDQDFNPKISDFGLAKLCSKDQSAVSMTTARGTMGYIAPEVFSRNFGNVSYKSDIYSFGILLLEVVGGRKNVDITAEKTSQVVYFPEWIYNFLEQKEDLRVFIEDDGDAEIAKKLAIIGLWCIQWHPANRPSMKVVIQMLEGGHELTMPPNPFASTNPTRLKLNQELDVIQEQE
ncbi:rust resistance kinase Lr10-like [Corylus avellana]|uniref:rust resistance kinase Lr10-like n=1 Tax=Corylus avellana TaxID=13451 RepID=UPI00286D50B6|nr:rust resistance kinase Lr10-like [Corylus avellana]